MAKIGRKRFTDGLRNVAVVSGIAATVLGVMVLIAGIALTHNSDGVPQTFLLKDLALVSFDGVVASNDTSQFEVRLHWFLGSLAWEFPTAPDGTPNAGSIYKGLFPSSTFSTDLYKIAADLGQTWDCPRGGQAECDSAFFQAFSRFAFGAVDSIGSVTRLLYLSVLLAVLLSSMTLLHEYLIVNKPYWMRCRCLILKRYCPCPRGTREQIEKLDDFVWDKVRVAYWALVVFAYGCPAFQVGMASRLIMQWLESFNNELPKRLNLNPTLGAKTDLALSGALACSIVSTLCILIRYRLSRRLGVVAEEQKMERGSLEETDARADAREDEKNGSTRYID